MNLNHIEALYHIARSGSFAGAASELHISQSALSHRVRTFEEELGAPLFVRRSRQIDVTPLGQEIYLYAERIFAELTEVRHRFIPGRGHQETGSLRVAATNIGITYLYHDYFERFITRYPKVRLTLLTAESGDDALRRVDSREADVAFTFFPSTPFSLKSLTLGSTELVMVAKPGHPAAATPEVTLAELRKWTFVRGLPGSGIRQATDEIFLATGGYPSVLMEASDTEYVKKVVGLGLGLALLPTFAIERELGEGVLRSMQVEGIRLHQNFGLVYRPGPLLPLVERFLRVCRDVNQEAATPAVSPGAPEGAPARRPA